MVNRERSTIKVLGCEVFCGSLEQLFEEALGKKNTFVINTINAHSYVTQQKDFGFSTALHASDVVLPDGELICIASKFLTGHNIRKIAGYELFEALVAKLNVDGGKVFFLGSNEETLEIIKFKMEAEFKNIQVGYLSPPYADEFTEYEVHTFVDKITAMAPDVIFVGLTAPKQEKLIHQMREKVSCDFICGVGAVFDFYSGQRKRAPRNFVRWKLEWFYRFCQNPKHLWKRNFVSSPLFIYRLLIEKLRSYWL